MVQRQRGMLGVCGVPFPQPGHHRLYGDVGETKSSSCKDVCDAGILVRFITLIGGHQMGHGDLTEDPWQVVLPC